jgi:hypothetical protein
LNPLTSKTLKSPATNAGDGIDALLGQGSTTSRTLLYGLPSPL